MVHPGFTQKPGMREETVLFHPQQQHQNIQTKTPCLEYN